MDRKQGIYLVCNCLLCLGCIGSLFWVYPKTSLAEPMYQEENSDVSEEKTVSVNQIEKEQISISENTMKRSEYIICLDAGHGGTDSGVSAQVKSYGAEDAQQHSGHLLTEKELAYTIAKRVGEHLEAKGVSVLYTREKDVDLTNQQRRKLADRSDVILISMHADFDSDTSLHGMRVFTNQRMDLLLQERDGFEQVSNAVAKQTNEVLLRGETGQADVILTDVKAPGIQINLGYLSNAQERRLLMKEDYRQRVADGIAEAILEIISEE